MAEIFKDSFANVFNVDNVLWKSVRYIKIISQYVFMKEQFLS